MTGRLLPALEAFLAARETELDRIPPARRGTLERLARYVADRIAVGGPAKLVFVCTHNSRRSHMAMAWAAAAALRASLATVEVFSAGREETAFHPSAVAALERAGFELERTAGSANPRYRVRFAEEITPLEAFSKTIFHPSLPSDGFATVMTCSEADSACPLVPGSAERMAITYEDPKAFDGSEHEAAAYDERCRQIAREMLWAFARSTHSG